jgi:hypothetical protein
MKLNEDGFPNFLEVNAKFDLDHNKELAEYIKCMYDVHYKLQHETFDMSPEKIRFLKGLDDIVQDYYFKPLLHSGAYGTAAENRKLLEFLKNEPDKQAAAEKLCDIYMKECLDNFKSKIRSLFNKEEK